MQKIGDLDGRLVLNHTVGNATDTLTLAISDWKMASLNLGVAGARLDSSRVQLDATAEVVRGELDADLDANVTQANFTGGDQTRLRKGTQCFRELITLLWMRVLPAPLRTLTLLF